MVAAGFDIQCDSPTVQVCVVMLTVSGYYTLMDGRPRGNLVVVLCVCACGACVCVCVCLSVFLPNSLEQLVGLMQPHLQALSVHLIPCSLVLYGVICTR